MNYEDDCRKNYSSFLFQKSQMAALLILFLLRSGFSLCRSGARLFRASTGGQRRPCVERSLWTLLSQIPSGKTEAAPCDICAAFSRSNRGKHEEKE